MSGLVSVVIPTYNRARNCRCAVESVLAQSYGNLEVIVVDDGSRDATREALEGIDSRVRYLRQENAGVSAARNRGLLAAHGEFVAFLDSDDCFLPWKIEAQLAVLRAHPEAGMVWTDMLVVDAEGREIRSSYLEEFYAAYRHFDRRERLQRGELLGSMWSQAPPVLAKRRAFVADIGAQMFLGNLVHTSTVLLRRERQEAAGLFDTSLVVTGEDYDFHYRVCRLGPVAHVDVSSLLYRVGSEDQLTDSRLDVWMARNTLTTLSRVIAGGATAVGLPQSLVRRRMAQVHLWVGRAELTGDRRRARRAFVRGLAWRPLDTNLLVWLLVSILPPSVVEGLRRLRRALRPRPSR
jgi:GT2 family glycosyltransferase